MRKNTMAEYRYTESGLDNVTIKGMSIPIDDAGEEVYSIPNVLGLHKVIAHAIVVSECGITPKELRYLRTEMELTQAELASLLKLDHQTVGRWERGETPIDQNAEFVIRMLAVEKLEIDLELKVEEVLQRCIPSARCEMIVIDGTDPGNYKLLAA
jgi:DNA-binding transcriptional regulator YiaG